MISDIDLPPFFPPFIFFVSVCEAIGANVGAFWKKKIDNVLGSALERGAELD